jgi:DNA polymerase-1
VTATRNYGLVKDEEQLEAFVARLVHAGRPIGFDIETGYDGPDRDKVSLHPDDPDSKVVGISFTNSTDWARYVPLAHDLARNFDPLASAHAFWQLLSTGLGVPHNAKFELRHLARWFRDVLGDEDSPVGEQVRASRGYYPVYSDTMIEAYIEASSPSVGLKALTLLKFKYEQAELASLFPGLKKVHQKSIRFNILELTPEVIAYACEDSVWALALHELHYEQVRSRLLYRVEMQLLEVLCGMEDFGVKYDWSAMRSAAEEGNRFNERQNAEIQAELSALLGVPVQVNLGSPKQVGDVLYGPSPTGLGLPVSKKTNTGAPSTDAVALEGLSRKFPVVKKILEWKEMRKLVTTYLEKYQKDYDYAPDGMTHPNIMQTAVVTGRFAVSDPPYQQTPKKYHFELADGSEFNLNFRSLIVAPAEHYVLGFDYSQIELRMMAGEAQEPTLLAAFDSDEDVHTTTASLMLGVPREQVTKEQRAIGKTMNFALLYGMGPSSLAQRLAIPKDEARSLYDQFFSSYSAISVWVERVTKLGKQRGWAETKFGRKCTIWELQSPDAWIYSKGERLCVNAPIQGAAADYMKLAMVRAHKALRDAGLLDRVHLVMNIHDALEFYVHESVDPKTVIDVLAPAVVFPVSGLPKIVADWHIGLKWGELIELRRLEDGTLLVKSGEGEAPLVDWRSRLYGSSGPLQPAPDVEGASAGGSGQEELDLDPEALREAVAFRQEPPSTPVLAASDVPREEKYAPDNRQAQEDHQLASQAMAGRDFDIDNQVPAVGRRVLVTISEMPDEEQYRRFLDLLSEPGPNMCTLVTPEGELDYDRTTSLSPDLQAQVSLALGGAEVRWSAESVDAEALTVGMTF